MDVVTLALAKKAADGKGDKGDKGDAGVGVKSITSTNNTADGETNVITVEKANAINNDANVISYVNCPNMWIGYVTSSNFQIRIPIERFPNTDDSTIRTELAAHPIDIYYYIP